MKYIVGICLSALILILTGCASVPMASDDQDAKAKQFATIPDKATLYIYRSEILGAALTMNVEINGKPIGKTVSKSYFELNVPPGHYDIVSHAENDSTLSLDLESGKNYFVWQEVKMGILYARNALQLVDEQTGRAGVTESKMIAISTPEFAPQAAAHTVDTNQAAPTALPVTMNTPLPVSENSGGTAEQPKNGQSASPQNAQAPIEKPALVSSNQLSGKVAIKSGPSTITVEKIARAQGCDIVKGANLVFGDASIEDYSIACKDGRSLLAHCEYRQCNLESSPE